MSMLGHYRMAGQFRKTYKKQQKLLKQIRKWSQRPNPKLVADASMVIKLLRDDNLVWHEDMDHIRIELSNVIQALVMSGLFQLELHLLLEAIMPEIALIDGLGLD